MVLLFGGTDHEESGGLGDLLGIYATVDAAMAAFNLRKHSWGHIAEWHGDRPVLLWHFGWWIRQMGGDWRGREDDADGWKPAIADDQLIESPA
jgi:hypothetical protein